MGMDIMNFNKNIDLSNVHVNFSKIDSNNNLIYINNKTLSNKINTENHSEIIDYINANGGTIIALIDINAYILKYKNMWKMLNLDSFPTLNDYKPEIFLKEIQNIQNQIKKTIALGTLSNIFFFNEDSTGNNLTVIIPKIIFTTKGIEYFNYLLQSYSTKTSTENSPENKQKEQYLGLLKQFYLKLTGNIEIKIINLLNMLIEHSIFVFFTGISVIRGMGDPDMLLKIQNNIPLLLASYLNDFPDDVCIFNDGVINVTPNICNNLSNKTCKNNIFNFYSASIIIFLCIIILIIFFLYINKN